MAGMQGKDFALIGALGALGYVLYEWYKSGQPLSNLLPMSTNAIGQTTASGNPGGAIINPVADFGMGLPTNAVIQPISTTPVFTSTPRLPSKLPSPRAPVNPTNVTVHGVVPSSAIVNQSISSIDATINADQAAGNQFAATHTVQSFNPYYAQEQSLANLPGVSTTFPDLVSAINAGALVMGPDGRWVPAIPGEQITY